MIALVLVGLLSVTVTGSSSSEVKAITQVMALLPSDMQPSVPIQIVDPEPYHKEKMGAFTLAGVNVIFVNRKTLAFQLVMDGDRYARAIMASTLWHEEQHVQGLGEPEAYRAQAECVKRLMVLKLMSDVRGADVLKLLLQYATRE